MQDPATGKTVVKRTLRDRVNTAAVLLTSRNRPSLQVEPARVDPSDIVIASYNVHKCIGVDRKFDPKRTVSVIAELGADLIAIQEADKRFGERSGLLDLALIEAECGLVPVPITALSSSGHGWHGNMLMMRKGSVLKVQQLKLPGVEPRGALVVDIRFDVGHLRIVAAHFGLLKRSRAQQARMILASIADDEKMPTLLIGDLNEWREGKRSSLASLQPVFDPTSGAVPSFPSRFPVLALDRVLGHPHELVTAISAHDTPLARIASDHLPVKAHIDLRTVWERHYK
ncbi:MAG: endonuclease/exonuclease/phosphatase family protein [Pararhizobium sp.]|nr:endonuclease/exonuclease/phosphatase family protein [Pararhizobium sp.]MDO9417820.1 endonuclease/exonuclease/phosphatase family protein [Pararhizobium sp.]